MSENNWVDHDASDRTLLRNIRCGYPVNSEEMPESFVWQHYHELRKRQIPDVDQLLIGGLKKIHARRCNNGSTLGIQDPYTTEHRLAQDVLLGELFKAYKKCIKNQKVGPAKHLLNDLEEQLNSL